MVIVTNTKAAGHVLGFSCWTGGGEVQIYFWSISFPVIEAMRIVHRG
jgi:hypothetical protein